jgi:DNA-binding NarL/FixJ family response regulator
MYTLKSSTSSVGGQLKHQPDYAPTRDNAAQGGESRWRKDAFRESGAPIDEAPSRASEEVPALVYLDPRAFTRDCVSRWLQSSLRGFRICILPDPEQIVTLPIASEQFRAVIVNAGPERMSSGVLTLLLSRVTELLPGVPLVVLSDYEDAENIREAFALDVRGYIPTSLASLVAVEAVRLVCAGGTFAPAATLLSSWRCSNGADGAPLIEGFTQRQAQILDCLRRGMANKLIAYELNMCESTVKVHIRNIMKKLSATNRTQVVYLTRGLFEGAHQYQRAS